VIADLDRLKTALANHYRLDREIGAGGMATVYLAHDLKHDRPVALKVLRPELAAILGGERFLNEIKVTANLQHPNILPLYDSGTADGFLFYVMPFVEGETLRDRMTRERQMSLEDTIEIAKAVAAALQFAHEHDVVHRDIKPENILLQAGQALVADFGIALAVSQAGGTRLTETGLSLGTPHYMSPEQATGDRELDARSDLYSLGCMVFEMLVGEPPHVGNSVQAIVAKILSDKPHSITQTRSLVPPNVDAAVQKALAKSPADRFTSAAAFAAALTNPSFALTTASSTAGAAPSVGPWRKRTLAVTGVAAALGVIALWGWLRSPDGPHGPVARYSIRIPAEQRIAAQRGSRIAISPDGAQLVYLGRGEGTTQLWLRPRHQLGATAMPGTQDAVHPFFSPNGNQVGYLTAGAPQSIRTVSLNGGPPTTILDSVVGLDGASWGDDDYIYFDGFTGGGVTGLMRVSARGGSPPAAVTTVDTAKGESDHVWPHALPGSKGVLFTVLHGGDMANADIAVVDLESGLHRVLVRSTMAKYAASGHLIYVTSDGTLMAAPFDIRRLELSGDPIALTPGIGVRAFGSVDLDVSQDGTLMYVAGDQTTDPSEIVWVNMNGGTEVVDPGWVGDFRTLALSPDGRQLAISMASEQSGEQQLWVKQLPRGPLTKITFEGTINDRPSWSPDGRFVTFRSLQATTSANLLRKRADGGSQAELVLDHERPLIEGTWSSDGVWLAYIRASDRARAIEAIQPGKDTVPVLLSLGNETVASGVRIAPNRKWFAYSSARSGRMEVYVHPFPNAGDAQYQVSTDGGLYPVWSHDGSRLFYLGLGGQMMGVQVTTGETFTMGERRALFPLTEYRLGPYAYDVSLDDSKFLMIRTRGGGEDPELIVVQNWFEELKEKVGN